MKIQQHFSPVTNEWEQCNATKRTCRYGASTPHRIVSEADAKAVKNKIQDIASDGEITEEEKRSLVGQIFDKSSTELPEVAKNISHHKNSVDANGITYNEDGEPHGYVYEKKFISDKLAEIKVPQLDNTKFLVSGVEPAKLMTLRSKIESAEASEKYRLEDYLKLMQHIDQGSYAGSSVGDQNNLFDKIINFRTERAKLTDEYNKLAENYSERIVPLPKNIDWVMHVNTTVPAIGGGLSPEIYNTYIEQVKNDVTLSEPAKREKVQAFRENVIKAIQANYIENRDVIVTDSDFGVSDRARSLISKVFTKNNDDWNEIKEQDRALRKVRTRELQEQQKGLLDFARALLSARWDATVESQ